jgi:hypothetical protein
MSEGDGREGGGETSLTVGICLTGLAEKPGQALLDEFALADILGVSTRTVRRMVLRGQLPNGIRLGGRRMWVVGKLAEFLSVESDRMAKEARRIAALYQAAGV